MTNCSKSCKTIRKDPQNSASFNGPNLLFELYFRAVSSRECPKSLRVKRLCSGVSSFFALIGATCRLVATIIPNRYSKSLFQIDPRPPLQSCKLEDSQPRAHSQSNQQKIDDLKKQEEGSEFCSAQTASGKLRSGLFVATRLFPKTAVILYKPDVVDSMINAEKSLPSFRQTDITIGTSNSW